MNSDEGRWIKVEAVGFLPAGVEIPSDLLELYGDIGRAFGFTLVDNVVAVEVGQR